MDMELNKIYNEDCLNGMKRIPDKSIDMILSDLPYGITKNSWDSTINLDQMWEQYERIIKDDGAILLTAQTPFSIVLGASNLKLLKYELIWEKTEATGFYHAKHAPLKAHENILVFYKNKPVYNPQMTKGEPYSYKKGKQVSATYGGANGTGLINNNGQRYPRSVLKFKKDKQKSSLHPTQKPLALFEWLIKSYTNKGDLVLDSCIGSGTTAVACMNTDRNYIGFEKEAYYYNLANERINKNTNQLNLLGG